jgi:DNA mismatch endonuclease (patch repair protein)
LEYWIPKIERTKQRDEIALANLKEAGWEPLVVWECETRSALQSLAERLKAFMLK